MFQFLLAHRPDRLHLIIGTRVDPPLPLARLRAHNQVSELRAEELCFASSEIEGFARTMRLALSEEAMHLLEERTEGWIAAIQLLALALRGKADTAGFLRQAAGRHRFVREYVSEDILRQQEMEMQRFLLYTSLLQPLCGPLCDAVLGETGSKGRLAELHKANLFVTALDEEETWYRYHPLFAEALLAHLRIREPEYIPELYRRASLWYEEQRQEEKACEYALLSGDQPRAAALLEGLIPCLLERGEIVHMRILLSQLPPAIIATSPLLSLASIWAQRFDQFPSERIDSSVEGLTSYLKEQAHSPNHTALWTEQPEILALLELWAAMAQGDTKRSITLAHQTSTIHPQTENALSHFIAESRRMTLGVLYRAHGDLEAAERVLLETLHTKTIGADPPHLLSTVPTLATLYEARGQLRTLGQLYSGLLQQFAQRENSSSLYLALIQVRHASLLYEWNHLPEAKERAQQAQEMVQRLKLPAPTIPLLSSWVQARIAFALGDADQAEQLLTQAALELAASPSLPSPQVAFSGKRSMETFSVRFALLQGQIAQTERWETRHKKRFDDRLSSSLSHHDYNDYVILARILLSRGRLQRKPEALKEALILLEQLRTIAMRRNLFGWLREIQVLAALTMLAQGHTKQALSTLGPVLAQTEPEGYIRLFADEGGEMAYLLTHIAAYTTASPHYIGLIQAALPPTPYPSSALKASAAYQPEPLSPREREVLHLVALGFSNQQIAQELVISLHTVKLHVKHLLAKLAVSNRTQAIARAHELHML